MYRVALLLAAAAVGVQAQKDAPTETFPETPLSQKTFAYADVPYQADSDNLIRGRQYGYNRCNSTTEGPESRCQTSMVNSIDDFCLWGPPEPNSLVGNTEGETVAWCTKPGHGTRLIPPGALKGVQFMKTSAYAQVVGFIDQTAINIAAGDYGGEMDPHGADLRGNPLGGLLYSNSFTGDANNFKQVLEWHNFMGSDMFCIKACDSGNPDAGKYCEHIYDRIGCAYNAPNAAKNGTFESCEGENQDFPGIYTGADGQTSTYTQPPEGVEPSPSATYTPKIPASSNCQAYTSANLYSALGSASGSASGSSSTGTASNSGSASGSGSSTRTSSGASASQTGDNGAMSVGVSMFSVVAAAFGVAFLA